jgi:hypothetical protein
LAEIAFSSAKAQRQDERRAAKSSQILKNMMFHQANVVHVL